MADDKDKTDHDLALKRFNVVQDNEKNQRELGVEDIRFAHTEDGQWDDLAKEKRAGRPMYTINRIAGALDQVTGDQRQNRTDIKVRPVSGGADEDRADIFNGLIRNIEAQSKASNAYDSAFDEQIAGGYGGWRVITEFNDDDSFEQDIKIKPIPSATTSLWFDPSAKEYDKRDGNWAFLTTEMQLEDFGEQFPDAEATSFDQNITNLRSCSSWFNRENNTVRVAEYWVKKPITRQIALMTDGRVIDLGEEKAVIDELALEGVTIERQRSVQSFRVEMRKMNGSGFISKAQKWAGKFIPLIPLFGKVTEIEGQTFVRGLVRFAKDPARIYNYETSAKVETTALTPKDPIWITTKQAEGHTDQLETFNTQNHPFMLYNSDLTAPGAPQRGGAPSVQQAMIEQTVQAERDIHATTGIFPAAMGDAPQLLSEKSVISQAQKGERGSFIFSDNLDKSKEYTGEILVDLIPKIYDTARIVRVMNIDGTSEEVQINQQALDDFNQPIIDRQTGEQVIVNDLTAGKYAVDVDTGPAFNTQRQESASQLIELANGNPIFGQVAIDLIAKNLNVLENDELTKRVRRLMIKQGIVDPTEEEAEELGLNQPQQPDPQQTAITDNINMQSEKLMSDIEKQDAETLKTRMQAQAETIKTYETLIKAYKTQQEAGIPLGLDEHQIRKDQQALVELGQDGVVLPEQ
jgi:hypothetical protein